MSDTDNTTTMSPKTTADAAVSFSIWPPSQRTRDAVTNRLIETLSTPSLITKRFGILSLSDATTAAKLIEDESFAAASGSTSVGDEDGVVVLQLYSKEVSKRMFDTMKAKAAADNYAGFMGNVATDNGNGDDVLVPVASEEVASVED